MLWSEVDFSKILVNTKRKITYDGRPFRFQLPEFKCTDGLSMYNQMTVEVPGGFTAWFSELEESIGVIQPWKSNLQGELMTLKIDDSSQIFDENKKLSQSKEFQGCTIKCILEVSSIYFFRETYGLTCRVYQIMSMAPQCLFLIE